MRRLIDATADEVRRRRDEILSTLPKDGARYRLTDPDYDGAAIFAEMIAEALPRDPLSRLVLSLRRAWMELDVFCR